MASLRGLTRDAVESTLDEFDALGREAFLERYDFGEAKGWYLVRSGKRYVSKAIVGVAVGRLPGRSPLVSRDFTGNVVRVLDPLEHEVGSRSVDFVQSPSEGGSRVLQGESAPSTDLLHEVVDQERA